MPEAGPTEGSAAKVPSVERNRFAVMVVVLVALGGDTPASTEPGAEVSRYYDEHQVLQAVSFVLAAPVVFLICFAVTVAAALWPASPAPSFPSGRRQQRPGEGVGLSSMHSLSRDDRPLRLGARVLG